MAGPTAAPLLRVATTMGCKHSMCTLQLLAERLEEVECRIPYSAGDLLADIRKSGTVVEESYGPSGTQLVAFVPPSLSNKLQLAGFARKRA